MPLSLHYVNEVLNRLPSTVVVDEPTWRSLIEALKFEGRDLEQCVLGRMQLRWTAGGYDGLLERLETLQKEREMLLAQVKMLTTQLEELTASSHAQAVS